MTRDRRLDIQGTRNGSTRNMRAVGAARRVLYCAAACTAPVLAQSRTPSPGYERPSRLPVFAPPGAVTQPPSDYATRDVPSEVTIRGTTNDQERPSASRIEFPENGPCRWLPVLLPRDAGPGNARRTSAEFAAQRRTFDQWQRLLANVPIARPPIGWCPALGSIEFFSTVDQGHALRTRMRLGAWPAGDLYRTPDGRLVFDGEVPGMGIAINRPLVDTWGAYEWRDMFDSTGRFFPEVPIIGLFQGFPVYRGNRLVVSRRDAPLQRPVRLDRALRWFIADRSRRIDARDGDIDRLTRERSRAQSQLAALSSTSAGTDACLVYTRGEIVLYDAIVSVGDRDCVTRLVERNPDIYDRTLTRSAPQLLVIEAPFDFADGPPDGPRPNQRQISRWALRHLVWGIDWQAVRQEFLGAP